MEASKPLLIKTSTCPACRAAVALLDGAGIHYDTLLADEDPSAADRYGVRHVPTLIIHRESDRWDALTGVDAIRDHIRGGKVEK